MDRATSLSSCNPDPRKDPKSTAPSKSGLECFCWVLVVRGFYLSYHNGGSIVNNGRLCYGNLN